ncbi:MAG: hypothetical protein HEQ23_02910 [Tepidisphaera sp.]
MTLARHIPRIGLCLLAGAVISYGVAWWFAYRLGSQWWQDEIRVETTDESSDAAWPLPISSWPGSIAPEYVPERVEWVTTSKHSVGAYTRTYSTSSGGMLTQVDETALGWPAASTVRYKFMQLGTWQSPSSFVSPFPIAFPGHFPKWYGGWHVWDLPSPLNPLATQPVRLPLHPRWPGLALNSTFYGSLIAVGFWMVGPAVRASRRRRGLCEACTYPRGTSAVCTECGREAQT